MSKDVKNKQVSNSQDHENSFVVASAAAIPIVGGPSDTDRDFRENMSQSISSSERQAQNAGKGAK